MLALTYQFPRIWSRPQKPFLCLLRIKYLLLTAFKMKIQHSSNHIQHVCTNASAHTWWRWLLRAFSLIIAVQILIANALDKRLKKRYNTTTMMGWSCEKRPHRLTTDLNKKSSAPYDAEAIDLGADFYDHIHDHRHDRSTWRQDATRARKVIFAVTEMSEKR